MAKQIFVSYSHVDREWLDRLRTMLAPLAQSSEIVVWDDTQIRPGDRWQEKIEEQLAQSNVAVLLVSPSFLASDYISNNELPQILENVRSGSVALVWIPVSASLWGKTGLAEFQAAIDPSRPLDQMTTGESNAALVKVAHTIDAARTLTDMGSAMHMIDATYDIVQPEHRPYAVLARHTGNSLVFEHRDAREPPIETITYDDLAKLPPQELKLFRALQGRMENEFDRWTVLYERQTTLTTSEVAIFQSSGRAMCIELRKVLDFIAFAVGKNLHDHYAGIRYACDELVRKSATDPA